MRTATTWRLLAVAVVLAMVLAACGDGRDDDDDAADDGTDQPADDGTDETTADGEDGDGAADLIDASACPAGPEISGDTIRFGTSLPQSGVYAAFAEILRGSQAYLQYVNEELGGVDIGGTQYQIELVAEDDAYQADQTVSNVTSLVNDEQVFGLFNVVGTKNNLAIRDFVNDGCVPSLFAATGAPQWGNHDYPWVIGTMLVPYPLEMLALVDHLETAMPGASIAVLRANDDFGASYLETLESLIEGTDLSIAQVETYDPEVGEVASQITSLAATDADVFLLGATLTACPTALNAVGTSGWDPLVYMSGTCTSKTLMQLAGDNGDGVISVTPLMDPSDPANDANEAMTLYKEKVAQYQPDADETNGIVAYGWSAAALLVHTLEQASEPTREAVMEAARSLDAVSGIGLQLEGSEWSSGADDWFLGEDFQLVQYDRAAGHFKPVEGTELTKANDQTEVADQRLIRSATRSARASTSTTTSRPSRVDSQSRLRR